MIYFLLFIQIGCFTIIIILNDSQHSYIFIHIENIFIIILINVLKNLPLSSFVDHTTYPEKYKILIVNSLVISHQQTPIRKI